LSSINSMMFRNRKTSANTRSIAKYFGNTLIRTLSRVGVSFTVQKEKKKEKDPNTSSVCSTTAVTALTNIDDVPMVRMLILMR
jgi:hypothetical protein